MATSVLPKNAKTGRIYKDMYVSVMDFYLRLTPCLCFFGTLLSSFQPFSFNCFWSSNYLWFDHLNC